MGAPASPNADKAFEFSPGIFGFPDVHRYVVSDIPGGGDIFKQLTALERADLGFTLVFPMAVLADYAPDIPEADIRELGADTPDQLIVMAIANVPGEFKQTTINLKAPLLFNPHTRKARQVILADDRYSTRHRLFKAE